LLLTLLSTLILLLNSASPMSPERSQPETALDATIPAAPTSALSPDDLARASDPALTPDLALALLQRRDLPTEAVEQITQNAGVMKSRKVRIAVAAHPRAPRRIALRLVREFYTFDLMRFALVPAVAADLKRAADDLLVTRLASITLGERISLARRASGTVAAALLLDKETRVWQTALENSRLTEAAVTRALLHTGASRAFVEAVCHDPKWSLRPEIRVAQLRNEKTPLSRALEFARRLPPAQLRDILHSSRLPEKIKNSLRKELESRSR
jgi:hypothetical protein